MKDPYSGQSLAWAGCGNSFKSMVLRWGQEVLFLVLPYSLLFHALNYGNVITAWERGIILLISWGSVLTKDQNLSDYIYRHLTVFIPHCPAVVMQFVYQIEIRKLEPICLFSGSDFFFPPLQFILDCLHLQGSFCLA